MIAETNRMAAEEALACHCETPW